MLTQKRVIDDGYGKFPVSQLKTGHRYTGRDGEKTYLLIDIAAPDGSRSIVCIETGVTGVVHESTMLGVCQNGTLRVIND
jgi:hypothetical protein